MIDTTDIELPLVSVVMPVHGRAQLAAAAFTSYCRQDYPNKQLIVVDDSEHSLAAMFVGIDEVAYVRPDIPAGSRMSIGAKRNLGVEVADGDILLHMDSDDLSAPDRISRQVRTLAQSGAPLTGYHTITLYDTITNRSYIYHYQSKLCVGASLCYTREWWKQHHFPDIDEGEDLPYTTSAKLHATDGAKKLVALLHDENTCTRKQVIAYPRVFREVTAADLPQFFFTYKGLAFDIGKGYSSGLN